MSWYSVIKSQFTKIAFPYAAIECPSCNRDMLADLGRVEQGLRSSNTTTDDPTKHPFRNLEQINYTEPQPDYDKSTGEVRQRTQDTREKGDALVSCPYCKQWSEISFEQDSSKSNPFDLYGFDFLDREPINSTLIQGYIDSGVPVVSTERMDDSLKPDEKRDRIIEPSLV